MRRAAVLLPFALLPFALLSFVGLLLAGGPARGEGEDPQAFLAEARRKHVDLVSAGLTSFAARLTLRRSDDTGLRAYRDVAGFAYEWSLAAGERFGFEGTYAALQQPYRDTLRGLHRELTGQHYFEVFDKATDLTLTPGTASTTVTGTIESVGVVHAGFSSFTGAFESLGIPKSRTRVTYEHGATPAGLRILARETFVDDTRHLRVVLAQWRGFGDFALPILVTLETTKNTFQFGIDYTLINGDPVSRAQLGAAETDARVKAFTAGWKDWGEPTKIEETWAISTLPDDRVSTAVARLGLADAEPSVRAEAAEALGVMGRVNVVPALISAMKRNADTLEVYLSVIRALGVLGDPRAVDALSKDWWSQSVFEYALAAAKERIRALGNIRHVSAVDALVDVFYMTRVETVARMKEDLLAALRKLTGQDLGHDPRAWSEWWKKSRSRHRFG